MNGGLLRTSWLWSEARGQWGDRFKVLGSSEKTVNEEFYSEQN